MVDGLSAGGDTIFQESDGVGLTTSVPSSRAGRTPGRRCIVPDRSIQQKKIANWSDSDLQRHPYRHQTGVPT